MPSFNVDPHIAKARTIDTAVYTSPAFFELAKEKIFATSWQMIADTDQVSENGACYPFTLLEQYLNEPLLLARDGAGSLRCLSNVCTHRGNLLVTQPCKATHLRCRYHGRRFGLDGQLQHMPEFKEVEDFPAESDHLAQLPLFQWGNWLFTSLQPQHGAEVFFKDMMDRTAWMPLRQFRFRADWSKDYHIRCNWALYCENYLEGFHIPFVHPGLNAALDFTDYSTELFFPFSSLQLGIAKPGQPCFDLPPGSPDHGKNVAAYYFWVFPNLMFNFYPWGLSINVVEPLAVDRTRVRFLQFAWREELRDSGAGADLDRVELEDEEIVQQVQQGVGSRFYRQGRYSVSREKGTHHFHRLLARFLT